MTRRMTAFGGAGTAIALLAAGTALAGDGADCPPNPEPGKCYEKVLVPPMYRDGALVRPGSFDWREVPCMSRAGAPPPPGYVAAGGAPFTPAAEVRVLTSPNLVRAVQTALRDQGYYRGPVTGLSDDATERSLARFQADHRLRPGWNKDTLRALGVPYPWGSPD
ncbi:MAG: peptidoglycan-binding domain-containing protein [Pseudomonadota bacterium]